MKYIKLQNLPWGETSHTPKIKKKQIIKSGELPGVHQFSVAYFAPGQKCDEHSHPDIYEIFYVSKGSGKIKIGERELSVSPGETIVISPGEKHWMEINGQEVLELVCFGVYSQKNSK